MSVNEAAGGGTSRDGRMASREAPSEGRSEAHAESQIDSDAGFPRAPLHLSPPRPDAFPTTQLTTLVDELRALGGDARRVRLAETIMHRYAEPLAVYARGSSLREIAEPVDLVHGYLAHSLSDPTFLDRYLASGLRLRRWLMNGLLLHARGVARDRARAARREGAALEAAPAASVASGPDSGAEAAFDRAWALALLSEACASVESALLAEGRDRAWTVFRRHAIDGRSYADLERELGLGRQQMADLVRVVTRRLRERVLGLLADEVRTSGGDVAEELRDVLRMLG